MNNDAVGFLKKYLKGQILLSFILAMLYSLGFGLVGLPWGYVIGFFTGFFSWVPFFGSLLGFLVAMIMLAFHFTWPLLFSVLGVYLGIQLLEALVLAPRILGRVVGLGFWQSLAAVLIGAVFFGPIGATVAIPVAAFVKYLIEKKAKEEAQSLPQDTEDKPST